MANGIFDRTIGSISQSLDLRQLKQNVTSSNIANADTPGYKAKAVEFEQEFREALGTTDDLRMSGDNPRHIVPREGDPIEAEVYDNPNGIESLDGNTVNRAEEMANLAENQILYNSSIEMMRKKLGMLRYAITEGGGGQ
jgi:flagellar basal-body rod protein FlgB